MLPGPKNQNMHRVFCCDLQRYRWVERQIRGEAPALPEARRNLDCFLDGNKLIAFGKPAAVQEASMKLACWFKGNKLIACGAQWAMCLECCVWEAMKFV